MPFSEILFRFQEKIVQFKEKAYFHWNIKRDIAKYTAMHDPLDAMESFREYLHKHTPPLFSGDEICKEQKKQINQDNLNHNSIITEAEEILSGNIHLLGQNISIQVGRSNIDPITEKTWPQCFYASVSSSPTIKDCDIKYIWEANRHQFLIILAKAYWLSRDDKYAKRVCEVITDWIVNNPYHRGVNWTSSLELAMRTLSWIWSFALIKDSKHITEEFYLPFIQSLCEQAKYIENHLSTYSSPYNHLIGEVFALQLIGSFLSKLAEDASRWQKMGWDILSEEIKKQFHEDGLTVEQATFYHHFTMGFYLQAVLLQKMNNKEVSLAVLSHLEKALEFSMYMTKPDGTLPMIGDIDNARSIYLSMTHSWDFRGFLGLGALLCNRPDFKHQDNGLSAEVLWLCSEEMLANYINMEPAQPRNPSKPFYKSGYFIFRDSWDKDSNYLCFDCGEIADGLFETAVASAAHGHADSLSFELSAHGKSFLVDGGFFTYFGELKWHKYFRQEEAHNTVKIGNFRQAKYCGRLKWQYVKKAQLLQWETTDIYDCVAGELRYSPQVCHQRKLIYLKKQFWLCCDFISANNHDIESYLHFDPAVILSINEEKKTLTACNEEIGLTIRYFTNARIQADKGGPQPSDGWIGLGYGIKKPAWRVQFDWERREGPYIFPLVIVPWRKQDHSVIQFGKYEWSSGQKKVFEASFSIDNARYSLIIDDQKNITLSNQHGTVIVH